MVGKNHMLADIVAIIGTLDIVFGEVDRWGDKATQHFKLIPGILLYILPSAIIHIYYFYLCRDTSKKLQDHFQHYLFM